MERKRVKFPGALDTVAAPSCNRMIDFTIASPSPEFS